jgi:hypothetical protein
MKDVRAKKDPDRCGTSQGHFGRLYSCLRTLWAGSRAPREGILEKHRGQLADIATRVRKIEETPLPMGTSRSCFEAAVGPDAVDDRQPAADLVPRDVKHPALLIEGALPSNGH